MAEQSTAPSGEQELACARPRLLIVEDELLVAWELRETARELGWNPALLSVPSTQLVAKPVRPSSLREALAWAIGIGRPAATAG